MVSHLPLAVGWPDLQEHLLPRSTDASTSSSSNTTTTTVQRSVVGVLDGARIVWGSSRGGSGQLEEYLAPLSVMERFWVWGSLRPVLEWLRTTTGSIPVVTATAITDGSGLVLGICLVGHRGSVLLPGRKPFRGPYFDATVAEGAPRRLGFHTAARRWALTHTMLTILHLEECFPPGVRTELLSESHTAVTCRLTAPPPEEEDWEGGGLVFHDPVHGLRFEVQVVGGRHHALPLLSLGPRLRVQHQCAGCGRRCGRRTVPCARCGDTVRAAIRRRAAVLLTVSLCTPLSEW